MILLVGLPGVACADSWPCGSFVAPFFDSGQVNFLCHTSGVCLTLTYSRITWAGHLESMFSFSDVCCFLYIHLLLTFSHSILYATAGNVCVFR
jgi:hypothetical protein